MQPEGPLAKVISIHAPRVGSDPLQPPKGTSNVISIHAPRVGSDFNSARGVSFGRYFNPRSPCGERPASHGISTHEERFQSTLPVWGATKIRLNIAHRVDISIHASRVGSDSLL